MKRPTLVALLISALSLSLRFGIYTAYASGKVRSVNGCRKHAKMESKTGGGMGTMASPGAMRSPAATR